MLDRILSFNETLDLARTIYEDVRTTTRVRHFKSQGDHFRPTYVHKFKRDNKEKIGSALSNAMAQLEIEDSTSDRLKKKELVLKSLGLFRGEI